MAMAYRDIKDFKKSSVKPVIRMQNNLDETFTKIARKEFDPSKYMAGAGVASFPYVPISCERNTPVPFGI